MSVYLRAKFEVSSILLTSFRQGLILPPPTHLKTNPKKPTQIRVKGDQKEFVKKNNIKSTTKI